MHIAHPPLPEAFSYFEVRPCIQAQAPGDADDDTTSFTDEAAFREEVERRTAAGEGIVTFWTVYGIQADGRATAIADDVEKESAHDTLAAMLGPFRAVLAILDDPERKYRIKDASDLLRGFIENCSTLDRI